MAEKLDFNFQEAIHGVQETKAALERARASMDRLEQLLTQEPRSFAPLAEPALRLRDRLIEDLETLEAGLARASSGPNAEAGPPAGDPLEPRDRDSPLGDVMPLGGQ